jgi:hypothetical protein
MEEHAELEDTATARRMAAVAVVLAGAAIA